MRRVFALLLLASVAHADPVGFDTFVDVKSFERVEIAGVDSAGTPASLRLERFDPIAADAHFVVAGVDGEQAQSRPQSHFYRGHTSTGAPAYVAVHANGDWYGIVHGAAGTQVIAPAADGEGVELRGIEADVRPPFECAVHDHKKLTAPGAAELPAFAARMPQGVLYNARLAIDTDQDYLARFGGNTTTATNYLTTLVGYLSTLYVTGADTQLQLSFSRLWTSTDPWAQTEPACMLLEVGKYWNDNMGAQTRSIMHFVSGKPTLGGIGWIGVLCGGPFDSSPAEFGVSCPGISGTGNYGGAYAVTSGVSGDFTPGNPTLAFDALIAAHELGHNFNSPHTHCYRNIGGNASPVDQCSSIKAFVTGCYAGPEVLPGAAGAGSGTIMSYCHRLSPGVSNITMTFGEGHGFGVAPARVNQRMRAHVQQRAMANPTCLTAPPPPLVFANGFE